MNAENQIVLQQKLPIIPTYMFPLVGKNIVEERLIPSFCYGGNDIESAMVAYRNRHAPEQQSFARLYFTEPVREKGKVRVRYLWGRQPRRTWVIGVTENSPEAIRILIGNNVGNCYMGSGIRWEFYGADRECEDLQDMGRIDQWDLLKDIPPARLQELAQKGIVPTGKWDFDGFLWERTCSVCGADIALSYFFFNIDSAVCEKCGNRPFLAPSLHQCLDGLQSCNYVRDEVHRLTLHVLHWMSHVHATFGEVRRDAQDECGKRIRSLAENTLIWRATERDSVDSVRALVEQNTSIDFGMYQSMCTMLRRAMIGEVPFKDEHRMAAEFVASATKLIHVRQLSTRE